MSLESKSYAFRNKSSTNQNGIVHAVVSVFGNIDEQGDVMCRGAFARCIERGQECGKLPPGVFYHDWTQPVAKTLDAWEEEDGLHVIGQFNLETQRGRETFSDIKAGIITEYSFGFKTVRSEKRGNARHILEVDWYEWSPVLIGANHMTCTLGVKSGWHEFGTLYTCLGEVAESARQCLGSKSLSSRGLVKLRNAIDRSLGEIDRVMGNELKSSQSLMLNLIEQQQELLYHKMSLEKLLIKGE